MATRPSDPPSAPSRMPSRFPSQVPAQVPAQAGLDTSDVVLRFLESIGRRSEAEFYLSLFRANDKEQFAACVLEDSVLRFARDAVVMDVRLLSTLGLIPVLVVGYEPSLDALKLAHELVAGLVSQQVRAEAIAVSSQAHGGATDVQRIVQAVDAGITPVLVIEKNTSDPAMLANAGFLASLLSELHTRKLIFLRRRGGIESDGQRLPLVNLTAEYDALVRSQRVVRRDRELLRVVKYVVDSVPHPFTVSITSPFNLLKELFTVKGAGTLLRRGSSVERHDSWKTLDSHRVRGVVESAFGASLNADFLTKPFLKAFVAENYQGVGFVLQTPRGPYLTKFAVERQAQGEGVGRDLWDAMQIDFPKLFWRAKPGNVIVHWYTTMCDGLIRLPQWHVFWRGFDLAEIPALVQWAVDQRADFVDAADIAGADRADCTRP